MATSAQLLQIAAGQVGQLHRRLDNGSTFSDWYQANFPKPGVNWVGLDDCAMFVSWLLHQVGIDLQASWVADLLNAFRFFGLCDMQPRPGDVVVFGWNGPDDPAQMHTGVVELVFSDGSVQTIEGDTRQIGNPVGPLGVFRHLIGPAGDRTFTQVLGFGHPLYGLT